MAKSKYYEESELVKKARQAVDSQLSQRPGAYESAWQPVVEAALSKLQNRPAFSYDPTGDALYRQYQSQYLRGGREAMVDTAARAAANTGGYGNSYAQTAAQQSYGKYMTELTDKIPELYKLALDRYTRQGDALRQDYDLAKGQENQDYARWRDGITDWETEYKRLLTAYTDERDFDRDLSRDVAADDKWQQEFDEDRRQFDIRYGEKLPSASSSGGGKKQEKQSEFDALAQWCRDQSVAGTDRDTLRKRISKAYSEGKISQSEMQTLTSWYLAPAAAERNPEAGNRLLQNYVR